MRKLLASLVIGILGLSGTALAKDVLIIPQGVISLRGVFDGSMQSQFILDLGKRDLKEDDRILIAIDSPGGSIDAMEAMLDVMHSYQEVGVEFDCFAVFAASAASAFLGHCDNRFVAPSSILMYHPATFGVRGEAHKIQAMVNFTMKSVTKLEVFNAKTLRMPLSEYRAQVRDELWISGDEAVGKHAADKVLSVLCAPELFKSSIGQKIDTKFGQVHVEWSACPLVPYPLSVNGTSAFVDSPKTKLLLNSLNMKPQDFLSYLKANQESVWTLDR